MEIKSVLIVLLLMHSTKAASFLLLPISATSHCLEMVGIGKELLKRGHTVTAYISDSFKTHCFDNTRISVVRYKMSEEGTQAMQNLESYMVNIAIAGDDALKFSLPATVIAMCESHCESALSDTARMMKLKSLNIDIVLVDAMPMCTCLNYIPAVLKARVVSVASLILEGDSGAPWLTNIQPFVLSTYTSQMTFFERFINTLMTVGFECVKNVIPLLYPFNTDKYKDYVPADVLSKDSSALARESVLFLENSDSVIEYQKATYPNCIRVGGLTTGPAKPLPKDLEKYFSQAKNGVVVVSFGSILKKASPVLFHKMLTIFQNLDKNVIIAYDKDGDYGNVKTVSWLPQNDVLGHAKTVLFISHCGKNGFYEGFYHGVPIICTPLNGDGFSTAGKTIFHGVGTSMDIVRGDPADLIKVIQDTLANETITKNMKRKSAIYHSAPFTAQERAVNAIEHVLKYGSDHLRPETTNLSFIAHTMIDIWFTLFLLLFIILFTLCSLTRCCCRYMCCRKQRGTISKKKKE